MDIYFSGWLRLLRLNLRRDRWQILFWILGIAGMSIIVARAFSELFPTAEERQIMAETVRNPAMIAMIGPSSSLDNYTLGAMFGHEMTLFMALTAAVMTILLTARHTRGDEEDGQLEMIRALAVGRLAPLIAVMVEMLLISLLIAVTNGVGVGILGIETMPISSSLLYGAALGGTALVFSGAAAIFAQLTETNRGTIGFSLSFLGIAYLFRGFTDLKNESLSWVSPAAWPYKTEVFVNDFWFPVLLSIVAAGCFFAVSLYLNSIRDLGSGFIPQRKGRNHAGRLLRTPLGLSFRLIKTILISWLAVLFIAGASYGSFFGDLESFFKSNDMLVLLLPKDSNYSLTEQFMTVLMVILSILSTIPVVSILLKIYGEEKKGRMEQLLSKEVNRFQLLGSYFILGFFTAALMILTGIIGLYFASSSVMAQPISLAVMMKSGFVYLPAIWFVLSLSAILVGYLPGWSSLVWVYLGFSFFVDYFGNLLDVPDWLKNISVFSYIPRLPVDSFSWQPLLIISGIAVVFSLIGFYGYRERDILG
ncbi:ABC transporter permease [Enterococcus sp. BWT-B8]|uniref:ABC transporter permease n=1 Tax=Enterococcus sp. BWT-B8 TaxID=2885157 RepID=UPI001E2A7B5F|nr:ABC transporter permease [Enterococcus sp. BWT-B8]MCB5952487.1 ABC transporter permease [Enterococcus sp. BWT-B8]